MNKDLKNMINQIVINWYKTGFSFKIIEKQYFKTINQDVEVNTWVSVINPDNFYQYIIENQNIFKFNNFEKYNYDYDKIEQYLLDILKNSNLNKLDLLNSLKYDKSKIVIE